MADGLRLFGWEIKRSVPESFPSFAPEVKDDGATVIEHTPVGFFSTNFADFDQQARTDSDLITRYRDMTLQPEVDSAITQIANEIIVFDDEQETVELNLEKGQLPPKIKEVLHEVFKRILHLLDFNSDGWDIFKSWYTDGRLVFHAIIDQDNPQNGILELRPIDPRCIRKVREFIRQKDPRTGILINETINEYYIYNEKGFTKQALGTQTMGTSITGIRIAKDAIVNVTSGLVSGTGQVLSYLHAAIKPLNQLRAIEDANVIYLLVRSPLRRVFYVDTGNLPKMQAEAHVRDMMVKNRNRLVYDPGTGVIKDDRLFQTMLDDYWLARREGNKSTEIDTLDSQGSFTDIETIEYFLKRLYKSLKVPVSRLQPETMYSLGRASEISRDEANFALFVNRLRIKFSILFLDILEKELILRNIIKPEEWDEIKKEIRFQFARENAFSELKELEIMTDRLNVMNGMMPYVGKYWSNEYIRRQILHQTDEDMEREDALIEEEMMMLQYRMPLPGEDPLMGGGGGEPAPGAPNAPSAPPMEATQKKK